MGSRRHPETIIPEPQPRLRRLSGACFNLMVRGLGLSELRDTQCGFKIFRAGAARQVFERVECEGFAFDVELFHLAERRQLSLVELPVRVTNSPRSSVRVARDAADVIGDLFRIRAWSDAGVYEGGPPTGGEPSRSA